MCSSNLDSRRFRFTLATLCSSQYLKELFISCFLSLSIFPPVSPLESGCKGKTCFSFSKLFKLFFQTFFPVPRLTSFPRALSLESGCKDKAMIHHFPNFFTVFFHLFFKFPTDSYLSLLSVGNIIPKIESYTIPCAVIASTTFSNPAMLAPTT